MTRRIIRSSFVVVAVMMVLTTTFVSAQHLFASSASPLATTEYTQRFTTLYNKIKSSSNGYFSPLGIPYHSVET